MVDKLLKAVSIMDVKVKKATMRDVAEVAGVSYTTVSLVLGGRGEELRIADRTIKHVEEVAAQLKYRPNYLARGLRGKATKAVALLWSLCGPHTSEAITRQMTLAAEKQGYLLYILDTLADSQLMLKQLEELKDRKVDGVVVQLPWRGRGEDEKKVLMEKMLEFPASVGVLGEGEGGAWQGDAVEKKVDGAFRDAVEHFAEQGRETIGLVGNIASNMWKYEVLTKHWQALGRTNSVRKIDIVKANAWGQLNIESLEAFLSQYTFKPGEGLFCTADEIAAVLLKCLKKKGLRVSEDVSVVGFNDSTMGQYLDPPLASITREDEAVIDVAIQYIYSRLENPDLPSRHTSVSGKFILRESAGSNTCDEMQLNQKNQTTITTIG